MKKKVPEWPGEVELVIHVETLQKTSFNVLHIFGSFLLIKYAIQKFTFSIVFDGNMIPLFDGVRAPQIKKRLTRTHIFAWAPRKYKCLRI